MGMFKCLLIVLHVFYALDELGSFSKPRTWVQSLALLSISGSRPCLMVGTLCKIYTAPNLMMDTKPELEP